MNTDYLKYLLVVADCGSIRQAAEQLHMKQQNLSIIIKNVEHQYDVSIFDRSHKGVQVTEDGVFFLREVRTIVESLDKLERPYLYPSKRYYSNVVDSINMYCTSMVGAHNMVRVLDQFREYFPYVNVNFLTRSREEILQEQEEKSLSILLTVDSLDTVRSTLPEGIVAEPLARMPLYATTARDNPEAQQLTGISVHTLLKKPLVLLSQAEDGDTFMYEFLSQYGKPDIRHAVNNTAIFLDLLRRNNFWSVCVAEQAQQNNLLAIPLEEEGWIRAYVLYEETAKEDFLIASMLKILSGYGDQHGVFS